jgi:hypothetical protein
MYDEKCQNIYLFKMQPLESDCIRVLHLEPGTTTLPIAIRVRLT